MKLRHLLYIINFQKDVIHSFHWEVALPLLEETSLESLEQPIEDVKEDRKNVDSSIKYTKSNKTFSPYDAPDEYAKEKSINAKHLCFKSSRVQWDKIMEFPELEVVSPENDLKAISDTFKSTVNIKLVYLKASTYVDTSLGYNK